MTKTFEEIWKEATEETDLKFKNQDTLSWVVFMKEELKSRIVPIIQQQALPEVPEFVAEYIKTKLDKSKNLQDLYDEPLFHTGEAYLSGSEYNFISWFNENTTLFEKAWTIGYQVEKPQLFYLKNMLTGLYLACDAEGYLETGRTVAEKFNQQEIDSMQTGSYEQIPVLVEDKNGK